MSTDSWPLVVNTQVGTAIVPTRPIYPLNYACGRCRSGPFAADMTRSEAIKHAACVHNVVLRGTRLLAVRV